nr:allergen Tha p 2-like [Hydra vulgaris]
MIYIVVVFAAVLQIKCELNGVHSASGNEILYGCHKSKCYAYCSFMAAYIKNPNSKKIDKTWWCYTNKNKTGGIKKCTTDKDCNGNYYQCVSPCYLKKFIKIFKKMTMH